MKTINIKTGEEVIQLRPANFKRRADGSHEYIKTWQPQIVLETQAGVYDVVAEKDGLLICQKQDASNIKIKIEKP